MHVDTGHNFPETIKFRDDLVGELDARLIVGLVQESIDQGRVAEEQGTADTAKLLNQPLKRFSLFPHPDQAPSSSHLTVPHRATSGARSILSGGLPDEPPLQYRPPLSAVHW